MSIYDPGYPLKYSIGRFKPNSLKRYSARAMHCAYATAMAGRKYESTLADYLDMARNDINARFAETLKKLGE